MSAQALITAAKATLATESAWTKGANARNADGVFTPVGNADAVAFDIFGAVFLAFQKSDPTDFTSLNEAYRLLTEAIPTDFKNRDIDSWNDSSDHAGVLALLNGI